jgi:hypothetical protein
VAYENAAALYNEALTLYREQHMQHAIANFVAAVKLYPALADGWFVCFVWRRGRRRIFFVNTECIVLCYVRNNLAIIAQALGVMDSATKFAALGISTKSGAIYRLKRNNNVVVF